MSDLSDTATKFFNKAKDDGPPAQSGWQKLYQALAAPSSKAEASEQIPQENGPPTPAAPVNPYANFANMATGKPYK